MRFSRRTDWASETNPLSELLARKKARGEEVIDLTESNPTRCGFAYLDAGWLAAFADAGSLSYDPDPRGLPAAREAVRRYYAERGVDVPVSRIFLTSGTSEGYSHLLRLLADPGDAVAVPAPGYPLFDFVLGVNDAAPSRYRLAYDGAWRLDPGSLEAAASGARAVFVVNPGNPTGHFVSASERAALDACCRRSGAALVSDEVFLDFAADGVAKGRSLAANDAVLTFTLSGVSKILGLPQMKLSWIVVSGPPAEADAACARLEILADTYLSVGTPVQRALPQWLARAPEAVREIAARVGENRRTLEALAARSAGRASLLGSEGGWYAVLAVRGADDEALAMELLEKRGVYAHPGYFFDFAEEGRIVLSLLPEPRRFEAGARRVVE